MYINGFTNKANEVLNFAIKIASEYGHSYVGTEHILAGITQDISSVPCCLLKEKNVYFRDIEKLLRSNLGKGVKTKLTSQNFSTRAKLAIENSVVQAKTLNHNYVGTEHILLSILKQIDCYGVRFLSSLSVNTTDFYTRLLRIIMGLGELNKNIASKYVNLEQTEGNTKNKPMKTPLLNQFAKDLTSSAKLGEIDRVIGRDAETNRLIQILSRRTKNNPCLVGEPGVGKTAIVEGLAQKICDGLVPENLINKRIFTLGLSNVVAGTKYRGDFEDRIKNIIEEVVKADDIILFIDEIHTIIGAGAAEGAVDAANILKPQLARGEFQIIGATTITEYRKYIEKDAALERRFQPININEPDEQQAIDIIKGLKSHYEKHHKLTITDRAVEKAVQLSCKYIPDRFLPDKAIDLIDEACSLVRINNSLKERENEKKMKDSRGREQFFAKFFNKQTTEEFLPATQTQIDQLEIAQIVSSWTGINIEKITKKESDYLISLETQIKSRVIGQDEAIKSVAKAIRRGRVGLKEQNKPIGSFIFLGSTGVGKTELCKALAETLFSNEEAIIRLDMSEYKESSSITKLIGAPPGYVGFDDGGKLCDKIRTKPYSVVLFDEIEKAHNDIFNLLLQILDDGILTDSKGRTVSFKNAIIVMTSNIGASHISQNKKALGFSTSDSKEEYESVKKEILSELKSCFRPEFLNRIDETIIFNKLSKENIQSISQNLLYSLSKKLESMGINIVFSPDAVNKIADCGFDDVYGARPLKRAICNKIEDSLCDLILKNKIIAGDCIRCIVDGNDEFKFIADDLLKLA